MKTAIREAITEASRESAVLVLVLAGHAIWGQGPRDNVPFLLAYDSKPSEPASCYEIVTELRKAIPAGETKLRGLIVIMDSCYSGEIAKDLASELNSLLDLNIPFCALAPTMDTPTYDAQFSKLVARVIENGVDNSGKAHLGIEEIGVTIRHEYGGSDPCVLTSTRATHDIDSPLGLWVALNVAGRQQLLHGMHDRGLARSLSKRFIARDVLDRLEPMRKGPTVTLLAGPAGSGKSATIASLENQKHCLRAIVFTSLTPTVDDIAARLKAQLITLEGFRAATVNFRRSCSRLDTLSSLESDIFGPLLQLDARHEPVWIAFDGVDSLPHPVQHHLGAVIATTTGVAKLNWPVRFLMSVRVSGDRSAENILKAIVDPIKANHGTVETFDLRSPEPEHIRQYLSQWGRRAAQLEGRNRDRILSSRSWVSAKLAIYLVNRATADILDQVMVDDPTSEVLCTRVWEHLCEQSSENVDTHLDHMVLQTLALAPVGPSMPFGLLTSVVSVRTRRTPKISTNRVLVNRESVGQSLGRLSLLTVVTNAEDGTRRVGIAHEVLHAAIE